MARKDSTSQGASTPIKPIVAADLVPPRQGDASRAGPSTANTAASVNTTTRVPKCPLLYRTGDFMFIAFLVTLLAVFIFVFQAGLVRLATSGTASEVPLGALIIRRYAGEALEHRLLVLGVAVFPTTVLLLVAFVRGFTGIGFGGSVVGLCSGLPVALLLVDLLISSSAVGHTDSNNKCAAILGLDTCSHAPYRLLLALLWYRLRLGPLAFSFAATGSPTTNDKWYNRVRRMVKVALFIWFVLTVIEAYEDVRTAMGTANGQPGVRVSTARDLPPLRDHIVRIEQTICSRAASVGLDVVLGTRDRLRSFVRSLGQSLIDATR